MSDIRIKIGKVYETKNGRKVEIIGLSDFNREFVGAVSGTKVPVYYSTEGTPIDLMTGQPNKSSDLVLVKELGI